MFLPLTIVIPRDLDFRAMTAPPASDSLPDDGNSSGEG